MLALHPAVPLAYCLLAMILAMAFIQPALSAIAFACIASLGLLLDGFRAFAKRLAWQLPVVLGIALLNCIFVQRGANVLFSVGPLGIHAESMAYGLCMGMALVTTMEAFSLLGEMVSGDEAISMMGKRFSSVALLVSMSLRLVPRMKRASEERHDALRACTALSSGGKGEGAIKRASRDVAVLISNAMEDSLVTADSMRSRGYGGGIVRTRYLRRRFAAHDGAALACVIVLGAIAIVAGAFASSGFSFYPRISNAATLPECIAFGAFFVLPHVALAVSSAKVRLANRGA